MSKKQGKPIARKGNCNPNRARSKNNPDGQRNDPKIDWPKYNKGRAFEGESYLNGLAGTRANAGAERILYS